MSRLATRHATAERIAPSRDGLCPRVGDASLLIRRRPRLLARGRVAGRAAGQFRAGGRADRRPAARRTRSAGCSSASGSRAIAIAFAYADRLRATRVAAGPEVAASLAAHLCHPGLRPPRRQPAAVPERAAALAALALGRARRGGRLRRRSRSSGIFEARVRHDGARRAGRTPLVARSSDASRHRLRDRPAVVTLVLLRARRRCRCCCGCAARGARSASRSSGSSSPSRS